MMSTREALEAALVANPDDSGCHAAYADLLIEEGDPRGEFCRLQLALEDPNLPADLRTAMEAAAADLLRRHEAEWLGPFAKWMDLSREHVAQNTFVHRVQIEWWRGWIDSVSFASDIVDELYEAAVASKAFRIVRRVDLIGGEVNLAPFDFAAIIPIISAWPLNRLGAFSSWNSSEGDGLVDILIASGIIERLSILDVSHNFITDNGAMALARCPAVRRLKKLIADHNFITQAGLAALAEIGHTDLGGHQLDIPSWHGTTDV